MNISYQKSLLVLLLSFLQAYSIQENIESIVPIVAPVIPVVAAAALPALPIAPATLITPAIAAGSGFALLAGASLFGYWYLNNSFSRDPNPYIEFMKNGDSSNELILISNYVDILSKNNTKIEKILFQLKENKPLLIMIKRQNNK